MKIRISLLDREFSLYIRTRDNWTCQRCKKQYEPPTNGLHCAHIFTRAAKATRFDGENAVALCYGCHSFLDRNPLEKYSWYVKKFGQERFDRLRLRHNIPAKIDPGLIRLSIKQAMKELQHRPDGCHG